MAKVTYITSSGDEIVVENARRNLMHAAVANEIPGIEGDCGGVCACGTCHVHIDEAWADKVGPATEQERQILDFEDNTAENSRLGCQVKLTPELDGLVVRVVRG